MAKIFVYTFDQPDLINLFREGLELDRIMKIPFTVMNVGANAILGRLMSSCFGSGWVYCRSGSGYNYSGQPTVQDARQFLNLEL